jgi:hypothetical protein
MAGDLGLAEDGLVTSCQALAVQVRYVSVIGEVARPGRYELTSRATVRARRRWVGGGSRYGVPRQREGGVKPHSAILLSSVL